MQARARALLVTEIQGLERLFKRTPKNSPDRPQLTRRLAEGYVELESAALRDKIAADIAAQDAKKKKQDATKFRQDAAAADKILAAARKSAIAYYTLMKTDYPDYSKLDEVLYYLAYEYEQGGDLKNARAIYFELIQKAPKSQYIPNAYLAFGELFFNEAQGDPSKWELAGSAYKEVIKYPPPNNKVYGYARYKLGYVFWNKGEFANALNEFKKMIEYGDTYGDLPNAKQLAEVRASRHHPGLRAQRRPGQGLQLLQASQRRQGRRNHQDRQDDERPRSHLSRHRSLPGRHRALPRSDEPRRGRQELLLPGADHRGDVGDEVRQQGRHHARRSTPRFASTTTSSRRSTPDPSEAAVREQDRRAARRDRDGWHLEAVGSGGVRGTGDKKTMALAAYLYKKVVDNFTAGDFAKFEFPRIVKDDWPTMYKIKYAMADLLYFQQRWEECGPAFDAVVAEDPKNAQAAEAAYASVLCYQNIYDQMYKGATDRKGNGLGPKGADETDREAKKGEWEKFKPKPLTDMQKGMVNAFNRYVCYIKPPKDDKDAQEQYVEVKYAPRAHLLRGAALGRGRARVPRRRHQPRRQGRRHLRRAALPRSRSTCSAARAEPPRPAASTTWARTCRRSSSCTARAARPRTTRSSARP